MKFKMTKKIRENMKNKLYELMCNTSESNEEIDDYETELHHMNDKDLETAFYEACCTTEEDFLDEVKEMRT